jgi:hypothetical protein
LYGSACEIDLRQASPDWASETTDLKSDECDTLKSISNEEEVLERLQRRDVHSDIQESNSEENLVLLERTNVELLSHRHDEVSIEVA